MPALTLDRATRLYESSCVGKQRFTSLAHARRHARRARHCRGVKGLGAYACPFCGTAHRGHVPAGGRRDGFANVLREAADMLRAAGRLTT